MLCKKTQDWKQGILLQDLNRQVVKSDAASFSIPELEFESPAFSQKGGMVENSSGFFQLC